MRLADVISRQWVGQKAFFHCEYDPKLVEEDISFSKATPTGLAEFVIDNPAATAQLVIGASYYFDITPVPVDQPKEIAHGSK